MYNEIGHYFLVLSIFVALTYNKRPAAVTLFFFLFKKFFFTIFFFWLELYEEKHHIRVCTQEETNFETLHTSVQNPHVQITYNDGRGD